MELFETTGNPMPPEPIISAARTRDGIRLRVARWAVKNPRGTVTVAIGRGEFIEQYYEIVRALLSRKLEVIIFDWRGQGLSDRESRSRRRGHVSSFAAYHRDLLAIETQILRVFAPRPWFALGHSMGGSILLDQAHHGTSPFERLILSAPMIDLPLRHKGAKRGFIRAADVVGLGRLLIPGGREGSLLSRGFETNVLTSDRRQYARLKATVAELPKLTVGSPTIRWLAQAFALIERFSDPRYSVATQVPILIVAAGADRIVDTAATERFAIRLKAGRCITLPDARHQLIMERGDVMKQFWAAFDAFVPGDLTALDTAVDPEDKPRAMRGLMRRLARRLPRPRGRPVAEGAASSAPSS